MYLAKAAANSEDFLICDFAQYYHVYDYKELRPSLAATLAMGLPEESRVKRKFTGVNLTLDQMLLSLILDDFNLFLWSRRKHKGIKPKSIFKMLTTPEKPKEELMSFSSAEAYEAWRARKEEQWKNGSNSLCSG